MASYDLLGNIAIIKGESNGKRKTKVQKMREAKRLLKIPIIKTVLEKVGKVHGRLRSINTKFLAGEKNTIARHRENDCTFKFDVSTCYFSSRLSGERKMIAGKIKKKDKVLVMFAGVGVYPIVINKYVNPTNKIVGVELGKDCKKYALENLKLNKMVGEIEIIQGDVKRKVNKKGLGLFDVVIMARPNLKESFLKYGLSVCKKGSRIFYNGFGHIDDKKKMTDDLIEEAKKLGRKIKIMRVVKAGDIAPYKYRWRVEIKVLN